jgi:hypothetical protein
MTSVMVCGWFRWRRSDDAALVAASLAATLGVREEPGRAFN